MFEVEFLNETSRWRARGVRYVGGGWEQVKTVIPTFELGDFATASEEPANPFLRAVIRKPLTAAERRVPVGVVSNTYALVQHREVGEVCVAGMRKAGVDVSQLKCEVGLSDLGEWMNLRLYFPDHFSFLPKDQNKLNLRVEAFNSVDGSSRLIVLLSWLRLVCFNGLIVNQSLVEVRDIHNTRLDLRKIEEAIVEGTKKATDDKRRLTAWQNRSVNVETVKAWADETIAKRWGKKAACRVFHICTTGFDVELADPFASGQASEKPVKQVERVPGAAEPASNLYEVCQALSWVATRRCNAEERVDWQADIPSLIKRLAA